MGQDKLLIQNWLQELYGVTEFAISPLSGGCVAQVFLVETEKGRLVVKLDSCFDSSDGMEALKKIQDLPSQGLKGLEIEAYMLAYLKKESSIPVPGVEFVSPSILFMEYIESEAAGENYELVAARQIASLHSIRQRYFGFEIDTLIGSLPQPNPKSDSWVDFFAQHRLEYMAKLAFDAGNLPLGELRRINTLCSRLDPLLGESSQSSLIHGDLWGGNILSGKNGIQGLIDPAVYFANREIELAFTTMFHTFSSRFYEEYHQILPIQDGFWEERIHMYLIYPILVHIALFGEGYLGSLRSKLDRFN